MANFNKNVFSSDTFYQNDFLREITRLGMGEKTEKTKNLNYLVTSKIDEQLRPPNATYKVNILSSSFISDDESSLRKISEGPDYSNFAIFFANPNVPPVYFYNTVNNFNRAKANFGDAQFVFNYYDSFYENIVQPLTDERNIPAIYNSEGYKQFVSASFSQTSSVNSLNIVYEDTFLNNSSSFNLEQLNNSLALSQSFIPYYNAIYIPNIDLAIESKFSSFLDADRDLEKTILSGLMNNNSKNILFYNNLVSSSFNSFVLDTGSYSSAVYKTIFQTFTNEYFKNYQIKDYFTLNKSQEIEVIGYKIKKYVSSSSTPLQEFYVSNLFSTKENGVLLKKQKKDIQFIDNQIKFGQIYKYEIDAIAAIKSFKNSYQILERPVISVYNEAGERAGIKKFDLKTKIISNPIIEIVQLPYFSKIVGCNLAPQNVEVDIYTKTQNDKEVIFNLNISQDIQKPIFIKEDDKIIFDKYVKLDDQENINFSLNNIENYEIYRIEGKKPTSYTDFSDKLYKIIKLNNLKVYNFIDNIKPNIKYYYTFRSTIGKNVSNPTDIFEVEMVSFDGASYPIIKVLPKSEIIIEINGEKIEKEKNKSFRRYLAIFPNKAHLSLSEDLRMNGDSIPSVLLNKPEDMIIKNTDAVNTAQVWAKKFKIRITSKQSGRKIDINMVFDKKDKKR